MVATKHYLYLSFVLLLISFSAKAQQCNNCNSTPSVALFEFDIQVEKPKEPTLVITWTLLHGLSWHATNHIIKNNGNCINFIVPFSTNQEGTKTIQLSATYPKLPQSEDIAEDYFITGSVSQGDLDYVLEIRLHASCSKKIIASSEVRFAKSSDQPAMITAAQLAAGKFLNLEKIIQQSELQERNDGIGQDISANNSRPITIRLSKNTLKAGEKTDVNLELKDCDGSPLARREIFFSEAKFEGMKIPGTLGGTISPAKVVTDANGIAKATFTLNSGSKEAIIAAYSPGKDVKGCNSIFFGDAPINIKYTHSGYVIYTYEGSSALTTDTSDKIMHNFYAGKENTSVIYRASFYGEGEAGGVSLTSSEDGGDGTEIPDILETGSYSYLKTDHWKNTVICNCASKGDIFEQNIKKTGTGEIKNSSIHFNYNEGSGRLTLNLNFNSSNSYFFRATHIAPQTSTSQDELQWPVNFDTMTDKNFSIKKEKAGNKVRYTIEGEQTIKVNLLSQTAKVKMVLFEE